MKNAVLLIMLVLMVGAGFAPEEIKMNSAYVEQESGFYLFVKSKPVMEYKFIGNVEMPKVVKNGRAKEMINNATERAKKQFPQANGLIIKGDNLGRLRLF